MHSLLPKANCLKIIQLAIVILFSSLSAPSFTLGEQVDDIFSGGNDAFFSVNNASISEGGTLVFTVARSGDFSLTQTVQYASANDTADTSDYVAVSGTLSFAPGQTTRTVSIKTTEDSVYEYSEKLKLSLSNASSGATISASVGTGTIYNNDSAPTFTVNNVAVVEGGILKFSITKTGQSQLSHSLNYATANGSAAGDDYTGAAGKLLFGPSTTTKTVSIPTQQDSLVETDETVLLNLASATNGASIADGQGIGTIRNDDEQVNQPPSLSVSDASVQEGGELSFTVTNASDTTDPFSVDYATVIITANSEDFQALSGTLNFAAGEKSKTVSVVTIHDGDYEEDETLGLVLSNLSSSAGSVADAEGLGTIYDVDSISTAVPEHHNAIEPFLTKGGFTPLTDLALDSSGVVGATNAQFRVNESGGASYSVPIALPAGVAGVQPSVGLSYSSQGGTGVMGLGWSVSAGSAIVRCRQTLFEDGDAKPITLTETDRFCLDGQRLIVVDGVYGAPGSVYKTQIDNYALRIEAVGGSNGDPDYFEIISKDGSLQRYGANAASSLDLGGKTLTWSLTDSADNMGNTVQYHYTGDADNHRLVAIHYADGAAQVAFNYAASDRADAGSSYAAGHKIRNSKRLDSIVITNNGELLREYRISYLPLTEQIKLTRVASIQECAAGNMCLPPLTFEWAEQELSIDSTLDVSWVMNARGGATTGAAEECVVHDSRGVMRCNNVGYTDKKLVDVKQGDINGDGFTDIVFGYFDAASLRFYVSYLLANSDCENGVCGELEPAYFVGAVNVDSLSYPINNEEDKLLLQLIDINADSRLDLAVRVNEQDEWDIHLSTPLVNEGGWFLSQDIVFSAEGVDVFMDIDGDGLVDLVDNDEGVVAIAKLKRDLDLFDSNSAVYRFTEKHRLTGSLYSPRPSCPEGYSDGASTSENELVKGLFMGDFNGDGQGDLVSFGRHEVQCEYWDYRRPYMGPLLDERILAVNSIRQGGLEFLMSPDMPPKDEKHIMVADLNGDGLSDLLYSTQDDTTVYTLSTGTGFTPTKAISNLTLDDEDMPVLYDINYDGYADLVYYDGSSMKARVWNNQSEYYSSAAFPVADRGEDDSLFFADMNGNGAPDRVVVSNARDIDQVKTLRVYYDSHEGVHNTIKTFDNGLGNITHLEFKRLNEAGDHYTRLNVATGDTTQVERCTYDPRYDGRVCRSYDVVDTSDFYEQLNNPWDLPYDSKEAGYAVFDVNGPMYVITRVESSAPTVSDVNQTVAVSYAYEEAKMQAGGRGFLGFRALSTRDEQTLVTTSTVYTQTMPFVGMPQSTVALSAAGALLSASVNYMKDNAPNGVSYYQPYVEEVIQTGYDLNDNGATQGDRLSQVITTTSQDEYGNVLITTTKKQDSLGGLQQEATVTNYYDDGHYTVHGKNLSGAQLGRLSKTIAVGKRNGITMQQRVAAFSYYADGPHAGMLKTEKVLPQEGASGDELLAQELLATYTYDHHGNPKTVAVTGWDGADVQTRFTTTQYDNSGRYAISSTNALGQTSDTVSDFNRYGSPQTIHHANGGTTTIDYNGFGQEIGRRSSAGGWSKVYRLKCNAEKECPATAQVALYSLSADGSQSIEYADALGRKLRTGSIGFNGRRIYQDTEYDALGRVDRVSEPYFYGESRYWTQSSDYDILGRAAKVTAPDGSVATVRYEGLTTITTNDVLQSKRERKNGLGELVEVIDHLGGRITYSYDTEGNMTDATVYPLEGGSINTRIDYDYFGRKIAMNDADKGQWRYQYNAFGELIQQVDAKNQTVVNQYDVLGRVYKRTDYRSDGSVENHTRWYFDGATDDGSTVANALGQTTATVMTQSTSEERCASPTTQYCSYSQFDSLGRPSSGVVKMRVNNQMESYHSRMAYDALGRNHKSYDALNGVVRDSDLQPIISGTQSHYTNNGHVISVTDLHSGKVISSTQTANARGQVTRSLIGGLSQTQHYDPTTGRIQSQYTDVAGLFGVQEIDYTWDTVGNLRTRHNQSYYADNSKKDIQESFCYDDLNRLVNSSASLSGSCSGANDLSYDSTGNITYKKDVGYYTYGQNAGPHAVTTIKNSSGAILSTLAYDANGNMVRDTASNGFSGGNRTLSYSTFDKPLRIVKGGHTVDFAYGPGRNRYLRIDDSSNNSKDQVTRYLGGVERISKADGTVEWKRQLGSAIFTITTNGQNDMLGDVEELYVLKDHLGSIDVIAYADGTIKQSMSFDAWGQRRNAELGSALSASALLNFDHSSTTRGYTGHEMVDEVGLIHMNGRIYDAKLARFLQADPFVQAATDMQMYNRYSYVRNNPLNATDPSGYILKGLWNAIKPFVGIAVGIALIAFTGGASAAAIQAGTASFFVSSAGGAALLGAITGAIGAALNGGNILKGTLLGAASGAAFFKVDQLFHAGGALAKLKDGAKFWARTGAAALGGGVMSALRGGNFGHGFATAGLSAVMGQIAGMETATSNNFVKVLAEGIAGGTTSFFSGGKFANGAAYAAFAVVVQSAASTGRKNSSSQGTFDWNSEGTEEERIARFNAAKSAVAGNEDNIKYIDTYRGATVDGDGNIVDREWLLNKKEAQEFLANAPKGTRRGFINGVEERTGGFLGFFQTSEITIYRSAMLGLNNASIGGYTGLFNLTAMDHAMVVIGHEVAHRYGIDRISNAVSHSKANKHGFELCRAAGGCGAN